MFAGDEFALSNRPRLLPLTRMVAEARRETLPCLQHSQLHKGNVDEECCGTTWRFETALARSKLSGE